MTDGIIIIHKSAGMTSHDVVARVRRITGIRRVGHTGTLDPDATGVLPICVGKGTKAVELLTATDKRYTATLRLGVETTTQDLSGEVVRTAPVKVTPARLAEVIGGFAGEQEQVPPMYSAVKVGGRRLYELARKGVEVERAPRRVILHEISILDFDGTDARLDVRCSKGTYIRTLCHDIGTALGCGGCMAALERTGSGGFTDADAVTLERLEREGLSPFLRPVDTLFDYPAYTASPEEEVRVRNGAAISAPRLCEGSYYKVYGSEGRFLCISKVSQGKLALVKSFY